MGRGKGKFIKGSLFIDGDPTEYVTAFQLPVMKKEIIELSNLEGMSYLFDNSRFADPNATFTSLKSLKDIAIGSGFGLRYDFGFFVLRGDIGFKTYDPSYREKNRWFKDYNFKNAVYNIGINYPF